MRIGMIVAIPQEMDQLFNKCGEPAGRECISGYEVAKYNLNGHEIFVAGSGAGEISAASTTQFLITKYDVEMMINFGVVGGLTDEMSLSSTVVVEKAVHYDFDASPFEHELKRGQYFGYTDEYIRADRKLIDIALETVPSLKTVTCASADKFIASPEVKKQLHETWKADICEMEAAGILLTCNRNKVPALLIKAVSDSVNGGETEFLAMVHSAAESCVKILLKILDKI